MSIHAIHSTALDLSYFPIDFTEDTIKVTIYPNLTKITLILIGKYGDANFDVLLTKES